MRMVTEGWRGILIIHSTWVVWRTNSSVLRPLSSGYSVLASLTSAPASPPVLGLKIEDQRMDGSLAVFLAGNGVQSMGSVTRLQSFSCQHFKRLQNQNSSFRDAWPPQPTLLDWICSQNPKACNQTPWARRKVTAEKDAGHHAILYLGSKSRSARPWIRNERNGICIGLCSVLLCSLIIWVKKTMQISRH